ncbi:MAG TPA: hypothetical protein VKS01_00560, partial [Bryobacteraceae bacterium]|nr:hypothetical protein [Bryobacteraceae bacterium]
RETILFLFTARYASSVPLFVAWLMTMSLMTFQVDGVMRVFARTRFLFVLNLARLAIIAGLIKWSLAEFHLLGAILVSLLATLVFKIAALARMKSWMHTTVGGLLPWKRLAGVVLASAGAGAITLLVKSCIDASLLLTLIVAGVVYVVSYITLIWTCGVLTHREREAIGGFVRRAIGIAPIAGAAEV